MAVAASVIAQNSSALATTSISFTSQPAGTWLVLIVSADDYRTTTGSNRPESSSYNLSSAGQDFQGFYVWTKYLTASESAVAYTIGSASPSAYLLIAITGATSTLDLTPAATATHTHGGGALTPTNSVTPTSGGNRYALGCCGAMHSTNALATATWANSYTQVGVQAGPATGSREIVGAAGLAATPGAATSTTATWNDAQLCSYGVTLVFQEASGGTGYTASPSDAEGITDSATRALDASRAPGDNVGVTDAATRTVDTVRSPADSVGVTDAVTGQVSATRAAADTLGITDSVTAAIGLTRAIDDQLGITDTSGPQVLDVDLAVDDPVGITDTAADTVAAGRMPADSAGITDSIGLDRATTATDPVGITDSAVTATAAARTPTDPVGIIDSVSVSLQTSGSQTLNDPVATTDAVGTIQATARQTGDQLGITDTVSAQLARAVTIADIIGITDTAVGDLVGVGAISRTPADSLSITDSIQVTISRTVIITDSVTLADLASAASTAGQRDIDPRLRILPGRYRFRLDNRGGPS